jgi:dTDP-4-dehydrorhamnose 3,5-epimerase
MARINNIFRLLGYRSIMKATPTKLPEVLLLEPKVFADPRGFFMESFNARTFAQCTGRDTSFVQDNHSKSAQGVLRGLHYQVVKPQAKLLRCVAGEIFDVAVDIRKASPRFGQWVGVHLSGDNKHQLWIPEGFAHGFLVLSETAEVIYKTNEYWHPEHDRAIAWNDPDIAIQWPGAISPSLSAKDAAAPRLSQAETFAS